jgi:predicted nucleic acid-binding protein
VLDTSVLIDAERHELLFWARKKLYTPVTSLFIVGEAVRVRTELAIKQGLDRQVYRARVNLLIAELSSLSIVVDYTRLKGGNYSRWLKDPDDEPILATALVGKAQYVVSWNTKDFPPTGSYAGVQYLTRRQFFDWLHSQHPERDLPQEFTDAGYRVP